MSQLRTVLLHRPGPELRRLTPRNNDALLFDGIPWVSRAQQEHDAFATALTSNGVEILYLADLLAESLAIPEARQELIASISADARLGETLGREVADYLADCTPAALATVLIAGLAREELTGPKRPGLVHTLLGPEDFIIDPLPNLLFTRDSSVWIADQVAITSLAMPARRRETTLTQVIYGYHPRFAQIGKIYDPTLEPLEGGDVLLLAPGVVAVGVGERTTPAGAERLCRRLFAAGLAHTVLVVPIAQQRATMHLDTVCTMVDRDAVLMYPHVADKLKTYVVRPGEDPGQEESGQELAISGPYPFLAAAATAMGLDRLRVIDTGLDPVIAEREQWDDGNNTLCIAPRLAIAYERNTETNAQLEAAGIEVIRIPGNELSTGRGGPRCMSCPISRAP